MKIRTPIPFVGKQLGFVVGLSLLSGCNNARLTLPGPTPLTVQSKGQFCLKAPDQNNRITKFMFVIDKSGSNQNAPGTDPNNKYRADSIQKFFNGADKDGVIRAQNPNVKWGYIAFQGDHANAYISRSGDQDPIYVGVNDMPNDVTAMNQALSLQRSNADTDTTPYHAALGLATKAIKTDKSLHPNEASNYVVLFMSDGMPTDYTGGESPAGPAAFQDVDDLMNTDPGNVVFSAAYYGENNKAASDGLATMAAHGKGKFVDLNKTSDFKIDDLLTAGQTAEPYAIKNFLVYNVNSAISLFNGEFCVDSDGDGICDEDEIKLTQLGLGNFDPQNRFSFHDGYGDYFHYLELTKQAKLAPCQDRSDEDHDLLTACEEKFMAIDSLPDGTIPQHKVANPKNPDTDGDGIIDGVEWLMLHIKSAPLDAQNVFRQPTGVTSTIAELIKQHVNPAHFNPSISPAKIYDWVLPQDHINSEGQRCYNFSQQTLEAFHTLPVTADHVLSPDYAHGEWDNMVLIYYIQTLERDPGSPGIYNYSVQPVSGNPMQSSLHLNLNISDGVFKSYVPPAN